MGDDRVFPMKAWNAWDRVRRAARAAGLKVLFSQDFLRHSHGTHALRPRRGLATVRDTLGHASLTTERYVHARPEKASGDYLAVRQQEEKLDVRRAAERNTENLRETPATYADRHLL
jgi:site-specific recombinase XerD